MTIIFRLETVDGTGVYRSDASGMLNVDSARHPMPEYDSMLMASLQGKEYCGRFHFGFISIEQLRAWFYRDDDLRNMNDYDIVLSVYRSDEVYVGHTQVCFNFDEAILVAQNNVLKFLSVADWEK